MSRSRYLAATYSEWLNWVAIGRIRCNDRIASVDDQGDGFDTLMSLAPDVSIDEDQAFILAKLLPDYLSHCELIDSSGSLGPVWLQIDGVENFFPLSELWSWR